MYMYSLQPEKKKNNNQHLLYIYMLASVCMTEWVLKTFYELLLCLVKMCLPCVLSSFHT